MFLFPQYLSAVRGKKRLDLTVDPAPDLVIEIDITSSSPNRLQVYADLGVAEVWICNGDCLTVKQLQNGIYDICQTSQFFASLQVFEIAGFLQRAEKMDYLELVKALERWVRSQIEK